MFYVCSRVLGGFWLGFSFCNVFFGCYYRAVYARTFLRLVSFFLFIRFFELVILQVFSSYLLTGQFSYLVIFYIALRFFFETLPKNIALWLTRKGGAFIIGCRCLHYFYYKPDSGFIQCESLLPFCDLIILSDNTPGGADFNCLPNNVVHEYDKLGLEFCD